jgi:putative transposase
MQNSYVESFNGKMRDELLNETLFFNLDHARSIIAAWKEDYNTIRPHSSLAYQTPTAYAEQFAATGYHATPPGAPHASLLHNPPNRAYNCRRL